MDLDNIEVFDGVGKTNKLFDGVWIKPYVLDKKEKVLLKNDESVDIEINMEKELFAPIKKGEKIGEVIYRLNGEVITRYSIQCTETIEKRTTKWVFRGLVKIYLL